jgi:WD40 repeat protein
MEPLAVFISYAHTDSFDFAHNLKEALRKKGKTVWIDVESIEPGSAFNKVDIPEGIVGSIAVIAIISPASILSEPCREERELAKKHGKKIIPILYKKPLEETKFEHDWIDSSKPEYFESSLESLLEAIDTDLDWKKIHTIIDIRSSQWRESKFKNNSFLMHGGELKEVEAKRRKISTYIKPQLTVLQNEFLVASHKNEIRNWTIATIIASVVFACIAVFSIIAAVQSKNAAQSAKANATAQVVAGKKGTIALAQQLVAHARQIYNKQDTSPLVATLLALESEERFPNADADEIIRRSIYSASDQSELLQSYKDIQTSHEKEIKIIDFSPDGKFIASGSSDGTARILNINTGGEIAYYQSSGQVTDVRFSPDNKILYVTSDDGHLRSWDVKSAAPILDAYHGEGTVNFDLSAEGKIAVSSGTDGIVHIWDAETGREIANANHNNNTPVKFVAISPDGTKIGSVGEDNLIKIWNSEDGSLINQKATDSYFVWFAFTPDSQKVISNSDGPSSDLWDVNTGNVVTKFDSYSVIKYLFSPDGQLVAILEVNSKKIGIWDSGTGKLISSLPQDAFIFKMDFSRDGKYLASLSLDGTVKLWNPKTGKEMGRIIKNGTLDFSFSSKGDLIALPANNTIYFWRISSFGNKFLLPSDSRGTSAKIDPTGNWIASFDQNITKVAILDIASNTVKAQVLQDNPLTTFDFSADGRLLITGDETGKSCIWKVPTGENIACFSQKGRVNVVAISPDLKLAVTAQSPGLIIENYLTIWNIETGEKLFEINQGFLIQYLTFSLNSKVIAVGGTESYIVLWEINSHKEIGHLQRSPTQEPTDAVVFSSNGKWIITNGGDGAHVWDQSNLGEISFIEYNFDEFYNLAVVLETVISPDQTKLASVNDVSLRNITLDPDTKREATIRIWDPISGEEIVRMVHNSWVKDLAWSPDGKYILSAGWDNIVRVWDANNGIEIGRIAHESPVMQIRFTPDGKKVITISGEGIYQISYWRPEDIISEGCLRVTRNLSLLEWNQYFGNTEYHATCPNLPVPTQ